jgi:hypothetical protein
MKRGAKLSLYVSEQVEEDLATLRERFPDASDPDLVRRALSAFADQVEPELEAAEIQRIETEAYGIVWN